MRVLEWIGEISRDADAVREGFQAQWSYVAANVLVPLVTGVAVALLLSVACRAVTRLGRPAGLDADGESGCDRC